MSDGSPATLLPKSQSTVHIRAWAGSGDELSFSEGSLDIDARFFRKGIDIRLVHIVGCDQEARLPCPQPLGEEGHR
jgi:hypothetical protein